MISFPQQRNSKQGRAAAYPVGCAVDCHSRNLPGCACGPRATCDQQYGCNQTGGNASSRDGAAASMQAPQPAAAPAAQQAPPPPVPRPFLGRFEVSQWGSSVSNNFGNWYGAVRTCSWTRIRA